MDVDSVFDAVLALIKTLLSAVPDIQRRNSLLSRLGCELFALSSKLETSVPTAAVECDHGDNDAEEAAMPVECRPEVIANSEANRSKSCQPSEVVSIERGAIEDLKLGRVTCKDDSSTAIAPTRRVHESDFEIEATISRCYLKAEGARWAARRRRMMAEGVDFATEINPVDREIIARAKSSKCYLWMCNPKGPNPTDLWLLDAVGGCFQAMADSLSLLVRVKKTPHQTTGVIGQVLDLLAESQSALRTAVSNLGVAPDSDQLDAYHCVTNTAREHGLLVKRHVWSDDPADPAELPRLSAAIDALRKILDNHEETAKRRMKLLAHGEYKVRQIANGAVSEWTRLGSVVDEIIQTGLPPSSVELRELLRPVVEKCTNLDDMPASFRLAVREIVRLQTIPRIEARANVEPTPEVREVARLLDQKVLLVIGGDARTSAIRALEESFALKKVEWVETKPHESIERFESYIRQEDVGLVVLMIRWSSHSFGRLKAVCDSHHKPFVRVPSGYSPNQMAVQILKSKVISR